MDNSYLNIIFFVIVTVGYFIGLKPKLTMDMLNNLPFQKESGKMDESGNPIMINVNPMEEYTKKSYFSLAIYLLFVILVQFAINTYTVINNCGGDAGQNIGVAGLLTFFPWIFLFGGIIMILIMFPGFKSAFSDVIGYFYVAGKANKLITSVLIDTNVDHKIEDVDTEPSSSKKKALQDAADAIIKLCGNMSILINQMVPTNFTDYWNMLKPLMKPNLTAADLEDKQKQLLELVVVRDNIGEALWYVYTAILLISVVQYNIKVRGCVSNTAVMQANYQAFLEQEAADKQKADAAQVNYTITN